jgi:hypothetical protein
MGFGSVPRSLFLVLIHFGGSGPILVLVVLAVVAEVLLSRRPSSCFRLCFTTVWTLTLLESAPCFPFVSYRFAKFQGSGCGDGPVLGSSLALRLQSPLFGLDLGGVVWGRSLFLDLATVAVGRGFW